MIKLSTKQRREIYSLSSLLLHLLVFAILLISLNSCTQKEEELAEPEVVCDTFGTVVNMNNAGGCGYLLVLDNGVQFQPVFLLECMILPDNTTYNRAQNSVANFTFKDGQRVKFAYLTYPENFTACTMGQPIRLICITEVKQTSTTIIN